MRVGLLSYNARQGDAIGNQVAEKLNFFQDRGAEVRVFVESRKLLHPQITPQCFVVDRPEPKGRHWQFLSSCDLVVAEYGQHYALLELLPHLAGGKPKIVVDYHGVTPPHLWGDHNAENLTRGVARRGLLWCADGIVVHSWFTYNELVNELHIPAERVLRAAYPIDIPAESKTSNKREWRETLGLQDAKVLLYVGRVAANKKVPVLVEALSYLRDVDPAVHLLVVGDDTDIYQLEADRCRQLAAELELSDRVHFLGSLYGEPLYDAYRCANVFVTASEWESFCIPLAEAMAFGVPVIAARATANTGTVADAGLSFPPGDAFALAETVRKTLAVESELSPEATLAGTARQRQHCTERIHGKVPVIGPGHPAADAPYVKKYERVRSGPVERNLAENHKKRIVVIDAHLGNSTVSGVTRSLAAIANSFCEHQHRVEYWFARANDAPQQMPYEGIDPRRIRTQSFVADPGYPPERHRLTGSFERGDQPVSAEIESSFVKTLPHSPEIIERLSERIDEIDAVVVGPYLSGITYQIARRWPGKTLLLPCFHDESPARLAIWHKAYDGAAGMLFHSEEEQTLAQAQLGFNQPNASLIGTLLLPKKLHHAPEARLHDRYLVYCGRFTNEKNVPLLIEYAERYCGAHPRRFQFVFIGEGNIPIPSEPWAKNLGVVAAEEKAAILACADACVTLSCNESLSLAALESWQLGTPVIAHQRCRPLTGHIEKSGGGETVSDYSTFTDALDDLWENSEMWNELGQKGREYVTGNYEDSPKFAAQLNQALAGMQKSLRQLMREKGHARSLGFTREIWKERFALLLERILDRDKEQQEMLVEVRRRVPSRKVNIGTESVLVPVIINNWGAAPAFADGPNAVMLCSQVYFERSGDVAGDVVRTPLPSLLPPSDKIATVIPVHVPDVPGDCRIELWAEFASAGSHHDDSSQTEQTTFGSSMQLTVTTDFMEDEGFCTGVLDNVKIDLEEAQRLQRLPDDYLDITQGTLAKLKLRIKNKLLNNFKVAYVDVLSRQQSAFNQQMLSAVQELMQCCEMLDRAVAGMQKKRRRRRKRRSQTK